MKKTLVLLAIALTPVVADAQAVLPTRVAQVGGVNEHGITVNGTAQIRVPASSARIILTVSSLNSQSSLTEQTVQPLVDALVKAGAERSSVQLPLSFSAGGYSSVGMVSAVVEHPTFDKMRSGVATVAALLGGLKGIRFNSTRVELKQNDCMPALAKARANAIDAARAKAALIAGQLRVSLGRVVNVNVYDRDSPDGSCVSQYSFGPEGPLFPYGGDTLEDYVVVPVTSNVTITYSIK